MAGDDLQIRAPSYVIGGSSPESIILMLYNGGSSPVTGNLDLAIENGSVTPDHVACSLKSFGWKLVTVEAAISPNTANATLVARLNEAVADIAIRRGIDLSGLTWKRKFVPASQPINPLLAAPSLNDENWESLAIPHMWESNENAWCRVWVNVPDDWRGRPLHVLLGGVDDNDITYWNGTEIGHINGWNTPRDYVAPENLIRWGKPNLLTVMVENPTFGGGLYEPPYLIVSGDAGNWTNQPAGATPPIQRPKPGPIGTPHPFRRLHVKDGVLRYPEGAEVALWGTNYYPMAWQQFVNMEARRVDMKATIRQDLDDLQRMDVEIIRIHVFDREISDSKGNLKPNIHLDLLDYLVSECADRGIYFYFTLIAWWNSPNARPDAFSNFTSKPGMMFVPAAKAAASNFIRQFLNHINPYSGRALKDQPNVCFLEIMNEPSYFSYGDITGDAYSPQGEPADVLKKDHRIFRELWQRWLTNHQLKDRVAFFPFFRYELMRTYLTEMIGAIRSTAADQPVAVSYFFDPGDDLTQAIADSECEAVTVSIYPGGWEQVNDGTNLLPSVGPLQLDGRLAKKARVAYEFDAPATNVSCYLYPAIAAHFRSGECQIACQFQYDTLATARWNTDWNAHWLNWLYTPTKVVSYMAAGEAFRRLPRGIRYTAGPGPLILPPMAVSFYENMTLLATEDRVYHSRQINDRWRPLKWPPSPVKIVGTGSSPYVDYGGSGLYVLEKIGANGYQLTVNPDAQLVGNCLNGSFEAPVGELQEHWQWFRLKMSGWERAKCYRIEGATKSLAPAVHSGWLLRPGTYQIVR